MGALVSAMTDLRKCTQHQFVLAKPPTVNRLTEPPGDSWKSQWEARCDATLKA